MPESIPGLVSTIIPVYNRPQMLGEAVASVLAQNYRPIEIVIVDDGSTDDTPAAAEQLVRSHSSEIVFHRKENSGAGPTREAGRQLARGEFIQYLDSDDLLRPNKFAGQVRALRDQPECGAAYGWICLWPENGPPLKTPYKDSGIERRTLFPWLLADRWWNTDAPLWRRSVCDAIGPWSDLRWSQDWEYDGRAGALGTQLAYTPEWVCDQRQHSGVRQTAASDWLQPHRLRSRKQFLEMMFTHAERAGIVDDDPHRQHFTRWVFAAARQCAIAGLGRECRDLLALADRAAGNCRSVRKGFGAFRAMLNLGGVRTTGWLMRQAERFRASPGKHTLEQSFSRQPSTVENA